MKNDGTSNGNWGSTYRESESRIITNVMVIGSLYTCARLDGTSSTCLHDLGPFSNPVP